MALSISGGGYQSGDGNSNEVTLNSMADPQTATSTATLSVAQATSKILVANPSTSAAAYTLPLAADLDSALPNARIGHSFDVVIVNLGTSLGAITMTTNTGWTLSGNMVVAITSSARFTARKTAAGAWTLYRTA